MTRVNPNYQRLVDEGAEWLSKASEEVDKHQKAYDYEKSACRIEEAEKYLKRALARFREALEEVGL